MEECATRFRSDARHLFHPWLDRFLPSAEGRVSTSTPLPTEGTTDDDLTFVLRAHADTQAAACFVLAELLDDVLAEFFGDEETKSTSSKLKGTKVEWLSKAMLLVQDQPALKDYQIAKLVGRDPAALSRSQEYQEAAKLARDPRLPKSGYAKTDSVTGQRQVDGICQPD